MRIECTDFRCGYCLAPCQDGDAVDVTFQALIHLAWRHGNALAADALLLMICARPKNLGRLAEIFVRSAKGTPTGTPGAQGRVS